ncbi:hypothetical protein ACS0TY_021927 [Phlomoides rotata]
MDGNSGTPRGSRGRKRIGSTSRRVWTFAEECELMHALKELVVKGNKCDNGFRSGYLLLLENSLVTKFPGCDLKVEPHVNPKIHVWKRQYVYLKNMLGISGVGLNSTTYHVDALPEVWESQIKVGPFTKSMRKKAFPFYAQWVDVFGNDRATGQDSQLYADAVNETMHSGVNQNHSFMDLDEEDESSPATEKNASECPSFSIDGTSAAAQANKKGVKWKQSDGAEMQFMDTVGNYCEASKSTFGQIAETMSHIAKCVGSEYDNRQR